MTRRKFLAATVLLSILALLLAGAASASILKKAYQSGQVVSPQPNSGSFLISSMMVVNPSGDLTPITGPLPANRVFILTKIAMYFQATDTSLNTKVTLNIGEYYRMGPTLNGGFCYGSDNISPGIPIVNLGATVYLHRNDDPNKTPIPGKLNLRLIGYQADLN